MIDAKKQAEMDQATAFLAENVPPMLRKFFLNCVNEGFTEQQAMELTKAIIPKPQ